MLPRIRQPTTRQCDNVQRCCICSGVFLGVRKRLDPGCIAHLIKLNHGTFPQKRRYLQVAATAVLLGMRLVTGDPYISFFLWDAILCCHYPSYVVTTRKETRESWYRLQLHTILVSPNRTRSATITQVGYSGCGNTSDGVGEPQIVREMSKSHDLSTVPMTTAQIVVSIFDISHVAVSGRLEDPYSILLAKEENGTSGNDYLVLLVHVGPEYSPYRSSACKLHLTHDLFRNPF